MTKTTLAILLLLLLPQMQIACQEPSASPRSGAKNPDARQRWSPPHRRRPPRVRTVLIQLNGLSAVWLERWLKERRFLPGQEPATAAQVAAGGLARLAAGARATALVPVDPTVAASNLATMLTGVFPAQHGILSNRFYRRGKRVNGFTEPMGAETIWQAAPRQGLRTVTWAVMGPLCDEPPPSLLRSVCYTARGRVSRPRPAVNVVLRAVGGSARLELRAGRRALGVPRIFVGLVRSAKGKILLSPPVGAVLRGGPPDLAPGQWRDVLWSGGKLPDATAAPRRITRVFLRSFNPRTGRARFYISGTAINLARPAAFRRTLDRAGVIRPALADERSFRKGRMDEHLFWRTGLAELDAAVALAAELGKGDTFDLAILYLGTVIAFGRQLFAQRGRAELSHGEVARFHAALERSLREVDRRLARILDGLDLNRTRVVLASGHGMVPVLHDVSLRAALIPVDRRIRVITAAGAGFVHLPPGVSPLAVQRRLARLRVAGKPVFAKEAKGRVVRADGFARMGLPETAADLFVQAAPGFSLSHRRTRTLTSWPYAMATQGFRSDLPAMHGVFLAAGPGVQSAHRILGRLHMTQVAAAVAAAVGMKPPKHARSGPPGLWRRVPPTLPRLSSLRVPYPYPSPYASTAIGVR